MKLLDAFPNLEPQLPRAMVGDNPEVSPGSAGWEKIRKQIALVCEGGPYPLRTMMPALEYMVHFELDSSEWVPVGVEPWNVRTLNVIRRSAMYAMGLRTWADLSRLTINDIYGFPNAGRKTVQDILRMALELSLRADIMLGEKTVKGCIDAAPSTPTVRPIAAELLEVAAWARSTHGECNFGEAIMAALGEQVPEDVRVAAQTIWKTPVVTLSNVPPDSGLLIDSLLSTIPETLREIARERVLSSREVRPTLEQLGTRFGVTRERIRQLEVKVRSQLLAALGAEEFRVIRWKAAQLAHGLGVIAPKHSGTVNGQLRDILGCSFTDVQLAFMLFAAGPYETDEKWIFTVPLEEVESVVLRSVDESGLVTIDVQSALLRLGVNAAFHDDVLAECSHIRKIGDVYVEWRGSIVEKCVTLLAVKGIPATVEELIRESGETRSVSGVRDRLRLDPRTMRVDPQRFGLRSWGLEEYSGIAEEIRERIERYGGEVPLGSLIAELTSVFKVSESSVRVYAASPMFVIEAGVVRLRHDHEKIVVSDDVTRAKGVFRCGERLSCIVPVTHDTLRGSGRPLGGGLAAALGVQPGGERLFVGPGYNVRVTWAITVGQGTLGSLRDASMAVGASEGKRLRLLFDTQAETVRAAIVNQSAVDAGPSVEAVGELTGIEARDETELIGRLAAALGTNGTEIRSALRERDDLEVLSVLPIERNKDVELNDALELLAAALGN